MQSLENHMVMPMFSASIFYVQFMIIAYVFNV